MRRRRHALADRLEMASRRLKCPTCRAGQSLKQKGIWVRFALWLRVVRAVHADYGTAAKPRLVQTVNRRLGRQKCSVECLEVVPDRRRHNPPGLAYDPTNRLTLALNTQTALALAPTPPTSQYRAFCCINSDLLDSRKRALRALQLLPQDIWQCDGYSTLAWFASRQDVAKPKVKQGAFPTPKQNVADALLDPELDEADLA